MMTIRFLSDMTKQLTQKAAVDQPENRLAERDWVPIWYVDGVMLVPHYTRKHVWVWPGGQLFTPAELVDMGGKESTTLLWPRYWL
jgi:hypothetical protein